MGYVLPIRPYQYNDYQRRMRIESHDPMHIEKSFPAILASQYYDIAREYTDPKSNFIDVNENEKKAMVAPENMYAQLTGKGSNFNHSI